MRRLIAAFGRFAAFESGQRPQSGDESPHSKKRRSIAVLQNNYGRSPFSARRRGRLLLFEHRLACRASGAQVGCEARRSIANALGSPRRYRGCIRWAQEQLAERFAPVWTGFHVRRGQSLRVAFSAVATRIVDVAAMPGLRAVPPGRPRPVRPTAQGHRHPLDGGESGLGTRNSTFSRFTAPPFGPAPSQGDDRFVQRAQASRIGPSPSRFHSSSHFSAARTRSRCIGSGLARRASPASRRRFSELAPRSRASASRTSGSALAPWKWTSAAARYCRGPRGRPGR